MDDWAQLRYSVEMDLLEDILKHAGLKARLLGYRSFSSSASIEFPCEKSVGFHVVTQGRVFIHRRKGKPLVLGRGDIALMARGCNHVISTDEVLPSKLTPLAAYDVSQSTSDSKSSSGGKTKLTLVSGAYQLWNEPVHPFFNEIPDWFVIKSDDIESFDHLQTMINLLAEEVAKPQLGSERAIQGILDVMFSLIMRRLVLQNSAEPETFSHATQDLKIKHALDLIHSDCARGWTLEELASEVGLSRAGFASRFKRTLGDTPLHYLTTIRIQKAMDLLVSTDKRIESVALEVGYQDAFGFSKAFKKLTGVPPRDFRAKNDEEKKLAWRL